MDTDYVQKNNVKNLNDAIDDILHNKDKTRTLGYFCIKAQVLVDYFIDAAGIDKIEDVVDKDYTISDSDKLIINEVYTNLDFLGAELARKIDAIKDIEEALETNGFGESCPLDMKENFEEYKILKEKKDGLDFRIQIVELYSEGLSILDSLKKFRDSIDNGSYRKSLEERARDEVAAETMLYGAPIPDPTNKKPDKRLESPMYY